MRNNGGGSLSDVVDMTGLFTGAGPVVQVRTSGKPFYDAFSKAGEAIIYRTACYYGQR